MTDLDEFWSSLQRDRLQQVQGWQFERDEDLLYFTLGARDGERYRIRLLCDGYRAKPPDPVFIDAAGSKTTKTAWPKGDRYFDDYIKPPPNCFVCIPWTRAGLEHHREWVNRSDVEPWNPATHSLFDLFNFFQRLLSSQHYSGRLA